MSPIKININSVTLNKSIWSHVSTHIETNQLTLNVKSVASFLYGSNIYYKWVTKSYIYNNSNVTMFHLHVHKLYNSNFGLFV